MSYGDFHRFLARTLHSQGIISLETITSLMEKKIGMQPVNILQMLEEINIKIKPLKQKIKIVNDEVTSEEMVVLLALGYDNTSKMEIFFKPAELEFYKLLMYDIMSSDMRQIGDIAAINLANKIKVDNTLLSLAEAERLLMDWVRLRYLEYEDTNYVLGTRAIHEFESYFANLPDSVTKKCYICASIVFRGYNCPFCPEAIHKRCLEVCLKSAPEWPCCKAGNPLTTTPAA